MLILNDRGSMHVELLTFHDNGAVPNSHLPVVYFRALGDFLDKDPDSLRQDIELRVRENNWYVDWFDTDAVFRYTHYHSTAHEMLVVLNGVATLHIGGLGGKDLPLKAGDAVVIPAGVAHQRISGDKDFMVAGLYPSGQTWDLLRQTKADYEAAKKNLPHVSLPTADPFWGSDGPLMNFWRRA